MQRDKSHTEVEWQIRYSRSCDCLGGVSTWCPVDVMDTIFIAGYGMHLVIQVVRAVMVKNYPESASRFRNVVSPWG